MKHIMLTISIMIGVSSGILIADFARAYIASRAVEELAVQMEANSKTRAEELRATAKQQAIVADRRNNARRINTETCNFWKKEYQKKSGDFNRLSMNNACSRL
ncbi:MAG: hypothetical protein RPU34_05600 [Candidatus Sedimenticola sp. (ex Thyasira tokunagai)]